MAGHPELPHFVTSLTRLLKSPQNLLPDLLTTCSIVRFIVARENSDNFIGPPYSKAFTNNNLGRRRKRKLEYLCKIIELCDCFSFTKKICTIFTVNMKSRVCEIEFDITANPNIIIQDGEISI